MEHVAVAIVGAGPAGLATSRELTRNAIEHLVLERGRIGETWRNRWDTFCLVTPNWSVQLPRGHYAGADPDGFMPRDEIVRYLEAYAAGFEAPVREGVEVRMLESRGRGFVLRTSAGDLRAESVVAATGAYQRPYRPAAADTLPADLLQVDVDDFRNEQALPPGSAAASRAARSQRSCTRPGGRSYSPAAEPRGLRGASATATSSGGCSRPASSTLPLSR